MKKHHCKRVALVGLILALCAITAIAQAQSKGQPSLPPASTQSLVNGGYLYMLVGPWVLKYEMADSDWTLAKSVTLPPPEHSNKDTLSGQRPPMPPPLSMATDGEYLYVVAPGCVFKYNFELESQGKFPLSKPDTLK